MGEKTRQVIEHIGCEEAQARLALAVYDSNVEEAIQHFDEVMDHVCVLKIKVKSPVTNVFGLIMAIIDMAHYRVIRLGMVLAHNPLTHDVNLEGNWFVFERKIYMIRLCEGWLQNATQELETMLFNEFQPHKAKDLCDALTAQKISEVKKMMDSMIAQSHSLPQVESELVIEYVGAAYTKAKKKTGHVHKDSFDASDATTDMVQVELAVQFVKGTQRPIPAQFLKTGDMVLTQVVDDRDIARYISHLLGGLKNDCPVPLHSVVEEIISRDDRLEIKVRFSPGIAGSVMVEPKTAISLIRGKYLLLRRIRKFFSFCCR